MEYGDEHNLHSFRYFFSPTTNKKKQEEILEFPSASISRGNKLGKEREKTSERRKLFRVSHKIEANNPLFNLHQLAKLFPIFRFSHATTAT